MSRGPCASTGASWRWPSCTRTTPATAAAPIEIPLTQDQLAGLAGVHLRLTSRVLGEARAAGLLDTSKRRLVVRDLEGLRQRAELGPSGQGAGR